MKSIYRLTFLASFAFAAAVTGCAEVDQAFDCHAICERYRDCFDSSYDADACTDRCENNIEDNRAQADSCESCIDDRSCSGAVFNCGDDCAGIVP